MKANGKGSPGSNPSAARGSSPPARGKNPSAARGSNPSAARSRARARAGTGHGSASAESGAWRVPPEELRWNCQPLKPSGKPPTAAFLLGQERPMAALRTE